MPAYGESAEELEQVRVEDNGEPLVDLMAHCPNVRFASEHPKFAGMMRTHFARETLAHMLCEAQSYLPPGIHLQVQDAFRNPSTQRRLFRLLCEEFRAKHPEWTEEDLAEHTNDFVASPYMNTPPPHTTGGAVDVTLVDDRDERLDMTSPFEWDELSAPTSFPGLSEQARRNRHLLVEAMSRAGFSNYMGEWWHWSYGDPAWALRTGRDKAIYGEVRQEPTTCRVGAGKPE